MQQGSRAWCRAPRGVGRLVTCMPASVRAAQRELQTRPLAAQQPLAAHPGQACTSIDELKQARAGGNNTPPSHLLLSRHVRECADGHVEHGKVKDRGVLFGSCSSWSRKRRFSSHTQRPGDRTGLQRAASESFGRASVLSCRAAEHVAGAGGAWLLVAAGGPAAGTRAGGCLGAWEAAARGAEGRGAAHNDRWDRSLLCVFCVGAYMSPSTVVRLGHGDECIASRHYDVW